MFMFYIDHIIELEVNKDFYLWLIHLRLLNPQMLDQLIIVHAFCDYSYIFILYVLLHHNKLSLNELLEIFSRRLHLHYIIIIILTQSYYYFINSG